MPLTKEQLSEIKKFIHSRGFTTIEVEMEILDHVASAVEAKLEANPNKSLTKAIHEVHAGFGVMGFSIMEDEFHKSYQKEHRQRKNEIIKEYLWSSSKALFTIMTFITSYMLGLVILPMPIITLQIIFYSISLVLTLYLFIYYKTRFGQWRKKSMVVGAQNMRILGAAYVFFYSFQFFGDRFFPSIQSSSLLFSLIITFMIIFFLYTKEVIDAAFNWTNERYLKYATH